MEEATHLAWGLVSVEAIWRLTKCGSVHYFSFHDFQPGILLFASYVLCILVVFLEIKKVAFFKSTVIRNSITLLHAADGITAMIMGLSIYYKSNIWMSIGILAMTKVFLLHLLSRMVTGVQAYSNLEVALQTTKTFLHHTGSFMFISDPKVALITALWRFTSMNGHAILSLKGYLSETTFTRSMWIIAHCRNAMVVAVLLLCAAYPDIRRGFAVSATGHIAYLVVRLGPVFRLGSLYMHGEHDKVRWAALTDTERLYELFVQHRYPYFALELGLLFSAAVYLLLLRFSVSPIATEQCYFI